MVSCVMKRYLNGIHYGVIIISEGVFHALSQEEIEKSGINLTYDAHGHPELGNISKAALFNQLLQEKLSQLPLDIKSRPNDMGYELRCCRPIGFDLTLCTLLGLGVHKLYHEGINGCIVSADAEGNISPVYYIDSEIVKLYINNLDFIKEEDYPAANKIVANPEEYDFNKILNR